MYKLCVFGGTTEGRELVEFLNTQPCRCLLYTSDAADD